MPHLSAHALQPGKVLHPAGTFLRTCSFSFHLDVLVIGEVDVTKQASSGCLVDPRQLRTCRRIAIMNRRNLLPIFLMEQPNLS